MTSADYKRSAPYEKINEFVHKYLLEKVSVNSLDVGSLSLSGSYREFFDHPGWKYTGMDLVAGDNVDVVSEKPYDWPFDSFTFDCLVSGQVLEHVEYPWMWIKEAYRVVKPGGYIFISAPYHFKQHDFPIDAWRYLPAGLKALFNWAGFKSLEIAMVGQNFAGKKTQFTIGAGQK